MSLGIYKGNKTKFDVFLEDFDIIEKKPIINYIFACDKTKNPTMKNIIRSIAKGIGSIDIKNLTEFDIDDIDMPNFNELSIDIQIKSSKMKHMFKF